MNELDNDSSSINKSGGFRSGNRNMEESGDFPIQNLQYIMYACGDVRHPSSDTVKLVYRILREQMNILLMEAEKVADIQNSDMIDLEHIIFLLRKSKVKLKRLLRYLQVLDFRSISVSNLQLAEDGENSNPTLLDYASGQNVKRCLRFLAQIEDCGEFTSILRNKSISDPTMAFRAQRRNLMSLMMSREEYKEFSFIVPRATFCSAQRKGQFRDWLVTDRATKLDISNRAITVINYLAIDTVAQLIDMALINKVQKTSDNSFIDQMYLTDLESPGINLYEEAMFYGEGNSSDSDRKSDALSSNGTGSTPRDGTESTLDKNSCTSSVSGTQTSRSSSSLNGSNSSKTSGISNSSSGSMMVTADDASTTSNSTAADSQSVVDISDPESVSTTRPDSIHNEDKSQSLGEWSADLFNEYRVIDDSASVEVGPDGQSSTTFPKGFSSGCPISKHHSYSQPPLNYSQKSAFFEDISSDENPHQDNDISSRLSAHLGGSSFSNQDSREDVTRTPDSSSRWTEKTHVAPPQSQRKGAENLDVFKDPKTSHIGQGRVAPRTAAVGKPTREATDKTTENNQSSVEVSNKSPAFYFSPTFKKLLDMPLINNEQKTSGISFTGRIHCTDRESSSVNLNEEAMVCGAGNTSDLDKEAAPLSNDGVENTSRDRTDSIVKKTSCTSSLSGNQESRSSCSLNDSNSKTSSQSNFSSGSMVAIADDASGTPNSTGTSSESMTYVAISEPESATTTRPDSIHTEDKSLSLGERNGDMMDEYRIIDDSASTETRLDEQSSNAYPKRLFSRPVISEQHSSEATFELNYEQKCAIFEDITSDESSNQNCDVFSRLSGHLGESPLSHHDSLENVTRTHDSSSILIEKIDVAPPQSQSKVPENIEVFKGPKTFNISRGRVSDRTTNLQHESSTAVGPDQNLTREAADKTTENIQRSVEVANRSPAFYFAPNFKKAFFRRTCLTPSDIKEAYASFQNSRHPLAFFQNPYPRKTRLLCLLETFDCVV